MRVRWLGAARADLRRIGRYIAQDNPSAAEQVTEHIRQAVSGLADYPMMGRSGRVIGTRELVVAGTPYIVPYRVRGATVEVLAVMHGAQHWPATFGKDR